MFKTAIRGPVLFPSLTRRNGDLLSGGLVCKENRKGYNVRKTMPAQHKAPELDSRNGKECLRARIITYDSIVSVQLFYFRKFNISCLGLVYPCRRLSHQD